MAKRHHGKARKMHDKHERYMGYGHSVTQSEVMPRHASGMIAEDRNAPSNLPRHVIEKYWPQSPYSPLGEVPDMFYGAQKQLHEDTHMVKKIAKPGKF